MPHKKDENSVARAAAGPLAYDSGFEVRLQKLESKLADYDTMALHLAAVEREVVSLKAERVDVRRLLEEEKEERIAAVTALKLETSQKVLVARTGAVQELAELDRKVNELDQGLRQLDTNIVKSNQGFTKFEKDCRQKVAQLQINVGKQVLDMASKIDSCAPRTEVKQAMKGIQFDMLNHSKACQCLAKAVAELKDMLDLTGEFDGAIEEILRWEHADSKPKKAASSSSSGSADTAVSGNTYPRFDELTPDDSADRASDPAAGGMPFPRPRASSPPNGRSTPP
jgi:hypothetical protein